MLRTNKDRLVKISVIGEIVSPVVGEAVYKVTADGEPVVLPGVGGITYNIRVGDPACGWMADHVEPGVSLENRVRDQRMPHGQSRALNVLSCVGNEAIVVKGDAKGERGTVVGKHGGIEHVMVDFQPEIMDRLVIEDRVMVKAYGVGLKLLDIPEVMVFNMDPEFLDAIDPKIVGGKLEIPVSYIVPASIMGSGLGASQAYTGDYDIQLFDEEMIKKYALESIRLGDIIAVTDADHSFGRIYKKGTVAIGIVVHSRSVVAGHGPGVTTLMSSSRLRPVVSEGANIATILKLR